LQGKKSPCGRFLEVLCAKRNKLLGQTAPDAPTPPVDYKEAADSVSVDVPVDQQPGTRMPLVIVMAVAGIAVIGGVVVFVVSRKKRL
jgi:hypothetical protein